MCPSELIRHSIEGNSAACYCHDRGVHQLGWRDGLKPVRQADWDRLKAMALSLSLPCVEEATTWHEPALKAHGKF